MTGGRAGGHGFRFETFTQQVQDLRGRGMALVRMESQGAHHSSMDGAGQIGAGMMQRNVAPGGNGGNGRGLCCLAEGRMARRHFIDHHTQRPDIRAVIHWLPGKLLGRHVGKRAHYFVRSGELLLMNEAGEPEIEYFYGAGVQQEDVSRLDVAMDNP